MTVIGHTLAGLSVAALCVPRRWSWPAQLTAGAVVTLFADVPDLPIPPFWGHYMYRVSHSLFVAMGILVPMVVAGWFVFRRSGGLWGVTIGCACAWLSHLLLDCAYNHGIGLRMGWPFTKKLQISLALPWFSVNKNGWELTWNDARIALIEIAFYGIILAACLIARRFWGRRQPAAAASA